MNHARLSALLLASLGLACDPGPPPAPFRAEVLAEVAVEAATGRGRFELAPRALAQVEDFDALEGPWFHILRGGELEARRVRGSIVERGEFKGGDPADLRYRVEDGVAVPRDYPTLAMLSAAYVFGEILDALEPTTGVAPDRLRDRFGAFQIFFEPKVRLEGEGTATQKFNAFFAPHSGDFGLARRSAAETVPLAADPKVLAHEVGHAVFALLAAAPDGEGDEEGMDSDRERTLSRRFEGEYALRGFDEGLADFSAFAQTGAIDVLANQDFIEARFGQTRSLAADDFSFFGLARASNAVTAPPCRGGIYCLGTLLARALYATYVELGHDPTDADARAAYARLVFTALAGARGVLRDRGFADVPSDQLVEQLARDEFAPDWDGVVSGEFLEAFLVGVPLQVRLPLCQALVARFGEEGFGVSHRGGCTR